MHSKMWHESLLFAILSYNMLFNHLMLDFIILEIVNHGWNLSWILI